jgi:hypothetical protein
MKRDGSVWTWGFNIEGQLGDGTTVSKNVPTRITLTDIAKWPITMFSGHNFVLKNDGTLWSWGYNYYGQLGDGTTVDKYVPAKMGTEIDWRDVASGGYHSMAIKNNGSLWSWGNDLFGQLGQGTDFNFSPSEAKPIARIYISDRSNYCANGNLVLTASEGLSYTWSTGATTRSITVNTSGTYSVTVRYPIGDVSTSD